MKKVWIILIAVGLLIIGLVLNYTHTNVLSAGDFTFNYFAAGDFALGVFAAGKFSIGIFSVGIFSIGIFSISIFNIGIYSVGIFVIAYKKRLPKLLKQELTKEEDVE